MNILYVTYGCGKSGSLPLVVAKLRQILNFILGTSYPDQVSHFSTENQAPHFDVVFPIFSLNLIFSHILYSILKPCISPWSKYFMQRNFSLIKIKIYFIWIIWYNLLNEYIIHQRFQNFEYNSATENWWQVIFSYCFWDNCSNCLYKLISISILNFPLCIINWNSWFRQRNLW